MIQYRDEMNSDFERLTGRYPHFYVSMQDTGKIQMDGHFTPDNILEVAAIIESFQKLDGIRSSGVLGQMLAWIDDIDTRSKMPISRDTE